MKNEIMKINDIEVTIIKEKSVDYICISDIAKAKGGAQRCADAIKNWLRNRMTLEYLGTWEQIYNINFKVVEFDHFKMESGLHSL